MRYSEFEVISINSMLSINSMMSFLTLGKAELYVKVEGEKHIYINFKCFVTLKMAYFDDNVKVEKHISFQLNTTTIIYVQL